MGEGGERLVQGAHPRSRGENERGQSSFVRVIGSSPLTRGKLDGDAALLGGDRLIPAHAGKTLSSGPGLPLMAAHPRSRGENQPVSPTPPPRTGSSPLTRGKPSNYCRLCTAARLIPAHAGKTAPGVEHDAYGQAHPRSRGENSRRARSKSCAAGSSPLTRGKRVA